MAEIPTCRKRAAAFGLLWSVLTAPASAEERANAVEAARRFDRGYLMAQQGSLEAAIREFEEAYALSPHPSVLYNLGQAYAASGRAAQAVLTLQKYLEQTDPKLDAERRAQAAALMDYQSQRVGRLALEVEPVGAEITLDGAVLGSAPLADSLPITAGVHGLTVTAPGHLPRSLRVVITAKATLSERVKLAPTPRGNSITITCSVPDFTVRANGVPLATLERGGSVPMPGEPRELRFERAGFLPSSVTLSGDSARPVDCGLGAIDPRAELIPLTVHAAPDVVVRVNGRVFQRGKLPTGRHAVTLRAPGLHPTEQLVEVERGRARPMTLTLHKPHASLLGDQAERRRLHRISAVVSAGIGVSGLVVAGVLYAINQRAYDDWKDEGTKLAERMSTVTNQVSAGEWNALIERENTLRARDQVALGSAVAGGAFFAAGAVLWLTAPNSPTRGVTIQVGRAPWVGYSGRF
jgi:hypothetical protein